MNGMSKIGILWGICLMMCLYGCQTRKVSSERTDYTKLVSELKELASRYERRTEVYRDSLMMMRGLMEKSSNVADSASHVETSYARSDAAVRGGRLYHSIENKDSVPMVVRFMFINVEKRDTLWRERKETADVVKKENVRTVVEKKRLGEVFFYASGWVAWIVAVAGAGIWFRYKVKKGEK